MLLCRQSKGQTKTVCGAQTLTQATSNWRGRGNKKFCIFKQPFVGIDS